ncbi:hypothetical protein [Pontibacter populi]|uniref:Four helix bundle protein n=1 Tax=Pontibacter populi TaxID=890055 RepID=A0ABV1RVQ0_9BACT
MINYKKQLNYRFELLLKAIVVILKTIVNDWLETEKAAPGKRGLLCALQQP